MRRQGKSPCRAIDLVFAKRSWINMSNQQLYPGSNDRQYFSRLRSQAPTRKLTRVSTTAKLPAICRICGLHRSRREAEGLYSYIHTLALPPPTLRVQGRLVWKAAHVHELYSLFLFVDTPHSVVLQGKRRGHFFADMWLKIDRSLISSVCWIISTPRARHIEG